MNAIAVSVLDASSIAPVVQAAKAKGSIPFTSDNDAPMSGRAVFVAQANDEGLGDTIIDKMVKRVGDSAKIGIVSARRPRPISTPGSPSCGSERRRSIPN